MDIGDFTSTRQIKSRRDDERRKLISEVTWNAVPKGSMFVVLVVDVLNPGEHLTKERVLAAMENLGWTLKPEEVTTSDTPAPTEAPS